jgi:hypothetical protein
MKYKKIERKKKKKPALKKDKTTSDLLEYKRMEKNWDQYFSALPTKDNAHLHKYYKVIKFILEFLVIFR